MNSMQHLLPFWKEYSTGGGYGASSLGEVARYVLGIQGSSASAERVFSRSGLTISNLKNRLGIEVASTLVKPDLENTLSADALDPCIPST